MSAAYYKYSRQSKQQPGAMADGGIAIGKLIGPMLKSVKLDEQCKMGILEEQWEHAVGKVISAHTRPGHLANKNLTVFVDSSPWLSELYRIQKDMLAKLQATFGRDKVLTLRLQLDPGKP